MIVDTITVTTAGTRVQSGKSGTVKSVLAKARSTNTGPVYVGVSDVASTVGVELVPGEAITFTFKTAGKMKDFYADSDNNSDKVDLFGDNS